MQLFYCPEIVEGQDYLDEEESRHCAIVLRKKAGDLIHITDGAGHLYTAQLTGLNPKKCPFILSEKEKKEKPSYFIQIAIAPTKNTDRIEWFVEKAVEIGIDKISFIRTAFSERKSINIERIRKKAISAMKQSIRVYLPEFEEIKELDAFLNIRLDNQKFIAHLENIETPYLSERAWPNGNYTILIGPEGGFTQNELDLIRSNQFELVKIGNHRLRTETAGVVACTILNDINLR